MGLPGTQYRILAGSFGPVDNPEPTPPKRRWLARWLAPLFRDETRSLCQPCRNRKLDFRSLVKKPPGNLREIVDNDDLEIIENEQAVHIDDFSFAEAKAARSECSLCGVLYWAAWHSYTEVFLPKGRFRCTLRPRYDWLRHDHHRGKLVHLYQVRVHFQPIENEMLFDIVSNSRFKPARKGRRTISAKFDINLLKHWLRRCNTGHIHPAAPSTLGLRMQSIIGRGLFRVINTSTGSVEAVTSLPSFVALSYVWGAPADQVNHRPLESKAISAHTPTIRDAAVLASSLGFEWLWVDRVCIDQTSESEKAILIPYMKDIYAAADLTIAAACGDSAQSGLLGSAATPRKVEKPLISFSSVDFFPVAVSLKWRLEKSVWGERGWTFEEWVFSKRLLLVFSSEVWFTCGRHTFRETKGCSPIPQTMDAVDRGIFGSGFYPYTSILHRLLRAKPANTAEVLDVVTFLDAIEEYSLRNLTFGSDRVAAVAGVILAALRSPMDEVSEQTLLRHGHPLRFFEILLTWQLITLREQTSPLTDRSFMPSWSWASSPQAVSFSRIRNRLLADPRCWFSYSLLLDNDILALPTNDNLIAQLVGIQLPVGLITDQPWIKSPLDGIHLGYEASSSTDSPTLHSPMLPTLHMITLVFDARFVTRGKYDHILLSIGSTETSDGYQWQKGCSYAPLGWSIHPELKPRYSSDVGSRPQPFETFAILTGRMYSYTSIPDEIFYDLYILLLDTAGQHNTYRRVGMARVDDVTPGSHFADIIRKGNPRWEYIRII
ncbi:heterokaryon incompatibility protein-domain-containing protein [Xylaria arbuscula]|nr:heterokaryon incompatibility protein-domain-containing protein [Xylaria arbuscula]